MKDKIVKTLDEILIIEDKEEYWKVGKEALESEGYKVDIATSYEEGISKIKQKQKEGKKFGVISDLFLPVSWNELKPVEESKIKEGGYGTKVASYEGNNETLNRFKIVWDFLSEKKRPIALEEIEEEKEYQAFPLGLVTVGYAITNGIPVALYSQGDRHEGSIAYIRYDVFDPPRESWLKIATSSCKDKIIEYVKNAEEERFKKLSEDDRFLEFLKDPSAIIKGLYRKVDGPFSYLLFSVAVRGGRLCDKKQKEQWLDSIEKPLKSLEEEGRPYFQTPVYAFGVVAEDVETSKLKERVAEKIKEIYNPEKVNKEDIEALNLLDIYRYSEE